MVALRTSIKFASNTHIAIILHTKSSRIFPLDLPTNSTTTRIMSTYKAQTPSQISSRVSAFYESFYAVSDKSDPATHSQYANAFTKNATMIMGTKKVEGYDQILELRKSLWAGPVTSRLHTLERIYAFGDDGMDLMLYGNVKYGLKNGKSVLVDWAGRGQLVEDGGDIKMKFYQVYLDSSVVANAMKD